VGDDQQWRTRRNISRDFRNQSGNSAIGQSFGHEFMAVARLAFQRDKMITLLDATRIDRNAVGLPRSCGAPLRGARGFVRGPERAHAAAPPIARAAFNTSSRSENGCDTPLTI